MTSSAIDLDDTSITDERGNIKIEAFGLSLSLVKAGESVDENGRKFAWKDNIKLSLPSGERLKLNAIQLCAIREIPSRIHTVCTGINAVLSLMTVCGAEKLTVTDASVRDGYAAYIARLNGITND